MLMIPYIVLGAKAGIFETVDWKSLLLPGTPPDVLVQAGPLSAPCAYSQVIGLMYNPEKVRDNEVPRTLSDLANPKWKGIVGILNLTPTWARYAYLIGKDQIFRDLRAILANGAIQARPADLMNRYGLREIWMMQTDITWQLNAKDRGMPAAWKPLQPLEVTDVCAGVRTGAKHPNAAKLVGAYLASPDGAKFCVEEAGGTASYYVAGTLQYEALRQAKKEGITVYNVGDPEKLLFEGTQEFSDLQKELDLILKGK